MLLIGHLCQCLVHCSEHESVMMTGTGMMTTVVVEVEEEEAAGMETVTTDTTTGAMAIDMMTAGMTGMMTTGIRARLQECLPDVSCSTPHC